MHGVAEERSLDCIWVEEGGFSESQAAAPAERWWFSEGRDGRRARRPYQRSGRIWAAFPTLHDGAEVKSLPEAVEDLAHTPAQRTRPRSGIPIGVPGGWARGVLNTLSTAARRCLRFIGRARY